MLPEKMYIKKTPVNIRLHCSQFLCLHVFTGYRNQTQLLKYQHRNKTHAQNYEIPPNLPLFPIGGLKKKPFR